MSELFQRIHGCEAAGAIANAMGEATEALSYQQIEERFGFVDEILPMHKKGSVKPTRFGPPWVRQAHDRPAGMTEDGFERHRLCVTAIIRKGGRITLEDLAATWLSDIDPEKFGILLGPQDRIIYEALKAGIPPWEVGRFASWPALIGTSKMIMPIGMVNACHPRQAAQDALELGRLKDVRGFPGNFALEAAAGIAAGVAEALRPGATVLEQLPDEARQEVQMGQRWAECAASWKELRPLYAEHYHGKRGSNAVEVLSGGLACFLVADGQPREAILYAVNLGRDTDCKAYVAGGLAGALRGIDAVPPEWEKVIADEVVTDPYTVSRRTPREAAEGLHQACLNELARLQRVVEEVQQQNAQAISS
jgi:ADP-ribosylglycohydrolase